MWSQISIAKRGSQGGRVLVVAVVALLCGAPSSPAREVRLTRTVVLLYQEVRLLAEIVAVGPAGSDRGARHRGRHRR